MAPRWPLGLHRYAGSLPATGGRPHIIPRTPQHHYRPLLRAPLDTGIRTGMVRSDGSGFVAVGPSGAGLSWHPHKAVLQAASPAGLQPVAVVYKGAGNVPLDVLATSYSGTSDSVGIDGAGALTAGDQIIAVWTGAQPGTQVSLRVYGVQDAPVA